MIFHVAYTGNLDQGHTDIAEVSFPVALDHQTLSQHLTLKSLWFGYTVKTKIVVNLTSLVLKTNSHHSQWFPTISLLSVFSPD